jgi:hypothetical protein
MLPSCPAAKDVNRIDNVAPAQMLQNLIDRLLPFGIVSLLIRGQPWFVATWRLCPAWRVGFEMPEWPAIALIKPDF